MRADGRLADYLHTVVDPWSSPLSRGLTGDRMLPMTCVVRRQNAMSFSLLESESVGAGVELVITMNDNRDPFLAIKAPGSSVRMLGADAAVPDNFSIPSNSYGRVIGAAVRIRYLGAEINRGGTFYHFPHDREGSGLDALMHDDAWGSMPTELVRAISAVQVRPNPITFHMAPETGFAPLVCSPDASFTAGVPANYSAMRLMYVGPQASCNFSIEVCEVIEYFHITHRHMATTTSAHPFGSAVHSAIAAHMQTPGSGNSSPDHHGDKWGWIRRVSNVVGEAGGLITSAGRTAAQAIWAAKGIKAMLGAGSAIASGAMVAL